jgi:putative salt-induced outer membrane protein YdiY
MRHAPARHILFLLPLLPLRAAAHCQEPPPVAEGAEGNPEEKPEEKPEGRPPDAAPPKAAPARSWSNVATLSYVSASGNSSANTLGVSDDFTRKWGINALALKFGMIRSESTTSSFAAVDGEVRESRASTVTAENFFASARFDYRLQDKDRRYWYGGASWERNRPVGLDARAAVTVGAGRIFADAGGTALRLDIGVGATREDPVVRPAAFRRDFGTFNLTSELKQRVAQGVAYVAGLSSTYDIKQSGGWLLVLKQSLTVAVRKGVALKVGGDVNYRNVPALISVPNRASGDPAEALAPVLVEAKRLDTVVTTSLVITF